MDKNKVLKSVPASQADIALYTHMGQALFAIQILEDCLSHAITLKKDVKHPSNMEKVKADEILESYQSYTLGRAIKVVEKANIFPEQINEILIAFLPERNWLVHKSMREGMASIPEGIPDRLGAKYFKRDWFDRITELTQQALFIQHLIQEETIA